MPVRQHTPPYPTTSNSAFPFPGAFSSVRQENSYTTLLGFTTLRIAALQHPLAGAGFSCLLLESFQVLPVLLATGKEIIFSFEDGKVDHPASITQCWTELEGNHPALPVKAPHGSLTRHYCTGGLL